MGVDVFLGALFFALAFFTAFLGLAFLGLAFLVAGFELFFLGADFFTAIGITSLQNILACVLPA